ncbi:MAG: DUF1116 domain-containing protein [Actinobacteria bacterium]|nr:DUF1116 domain-containing protein [Actinomycetota bacterium]
MADLVSRRRIADRSSGPVEWPVRRRDALRRGDDHRDRADRADPLEHSARRRVTDRSAGRGRRPRHDRFRRRRTDRRKGPPDDRSVVAAAAHHPGSRRPRCRRRSHRCGPGPRFAPESRGRPGPGDRPGADPGRGQPHRCGGRPAGARRPGRDAARGRRLRVRLQRRSHSIRVRARRDASVTALLRAEPRLITAGVDLLAEAVEAQAADVERVQWSPPMAGSASDLALVMADQRRDSANALALERLLAVRAHLVDVVPAREALGLGRADVLHAGPPLDWDRASGPMRGALMGAAVYEGLAPDPDTATQLIAGGGLHLDPCHHHHAVGPMAGIVTPSMWLFVIEDRSSGRRTYCSLNEGLGKVLRYGAYSAEVIERLHWMSDVLGPLMQQAVRTAGPIEVTAILAQMVQMGDEAHNRNRAGTLMLLRDLLPSLVSTDAASSDIADAARFIGANDHFFLNLAMPACKLALDAARDIPGSTMVVAMARNGTDFGIQVSGTGDRWFTGPAQVPDGLFLGDFGPDDANPDIGDSAITETGGLGGFAMAAAPAIVRFVGGTVADALDNTRRMYEITLAEHTQYLVPALDFRGTPVGIDVTRVVRTGILPQINTGMAGKIAGTGQVGAGLVTPPPEIFPDALSALATLATDHA